MASWSRARLESGASLALVLVLIGAVLYPKLRHHMAPRPSEAQCQRLVDRYIEHASRQHHPSVTAIDIHRTQAKSRSAVTRSADVRRCQSDLASSQVECGLRAADVDAIERCMQ